MPFNLPKGKPEFSKLEESILQYWKENKTFEKSVESRPAENPYRFYDGPPFITGTPHYGSLLSSIIKDVVPRYQTMLGKRVERVWGWDCHGLPIEQKVQKKMGFESNKEIEESEGGIQGFIDECYNYTRDTSSEWGWYIDHIGRWVDMDNAYRTMDQNYMESVMWVFKQIWEKGYIYEGKRVSWYSWKLSTPISNFEIAMDDSYQDVQDPAITVKFPILDVKRGAGVIIQDGEEKLLMIKNKKDGLWRFSGGGVEAGETYHDAAARELLEETGITCELTPYCSTYIGYRGEFYEVLSFRGTVPVGTKVQLEADKFSEYEYFSLDALPIMSEIHRMEHDLIDFITGVREPVILSEAPFGKGVPTEEAGDFQNGKSSVTPASGQLLSKGAHARTINILAWTTTPWTMPMHMALAVNRELHYVAVYHAEEVYILAASRVETVFKGKGDYQILCTIPGDELVGLTYQAPFDFYQKRQIQDTDEIDERQGGKFEYTHDGYLRYVLGVIKNKNGEILMLQNIKHGMNWQCPGGKIDKGETAETAVIREIKEELGVDAVILKKLGNHRCQTAGNTYWQGEYFEVELQGDPVIQEPHKHAQMQWTSIVPDDTREVGFHVEFANGESITDDLGLSIAYDASAIFGFEHITKKPHDVFAKSFTIYHADFVTDTDGTGIAHEAPEFGDVDFQLAKEKGIFITSALDEAGKYTAEVPDYQGQLYLDCIEPITDRLKTEGKLFKKEGITHRVPYCPRSNTPLIQKAQKSWFIDIQRIKSELIAQNESINWFPDHFKHGRFLKSLESAPDWCISRSRFWGTPMPVWQNKDGSERVVIDSREELYQKNKPLGQITKLVILRHAQSETNVAKCYDDTGTSPLSELGKKQAQDLVEKLQKEGVEVIISSPFLRTIQTITPFSQASGIPIETMIELKETEHGKFANMPQIGDEWAECRKRFGTDMDYKFGETGESQNDLRARGQKVIDHIQQKYPGKTVAIVSHGFPARALEEQMGAKSRKGSVENADPRVIYLDNNTGKEINLHRPYIDRIYIPGTSLETFLNLTPTLSSQERGPGIETIPPSPARGRAGDEVQSSKIKKILGIHGYNRTGEKVNFLGSLKKYFENREISVTVPFFQSGDHADYKTWENVLDKAFTDDIDTIVTHSMGGKIAIEYIIAHQKKLKRIVFVAPSLTSKTDEVRKLYDTLTQDVTVLKSYVDEIIVISSLDDIGREGMAKAFATSVGARYIEVNGYGHFSLESCQLIECIVEHGAPLRRIPEVLDVWMDSASMPYAQVHYPFENMEKMEASFPADFIAEYTGQIRAWFYVMHAIGVMVKGSPAFKNVAVTGVINGTDGRKMSKSFGNYPDPRETIEKYGADAIRFYLMGGTLMKGEDMTFSEAGIQESIKRVLLPLWNSYTFFATYANIDGWNLAPFGKGGGKTEGKKGDFDPENPQPSQSSDSSFQKGAYQTPKTHELDTWIISRLHTLIQDVRTSMDTYDLQKTCDAIMLFLDGLNNWYIRRNRRRFWRSELDADKKSAYETLHEVLVTITKLLAPICPFISEYLYGNLMGVSSSSGERVYSEAGTGDMPVGISSKDPGIQANKLSRSEADNNKKIYNGLDSRVKPENDGKNSVHLTDFPVCDTSKIDEKVNQKMSDLQALTNLGLAIRGREKLRVRQPLRAATITLELDDGARETLAEELNVKEIHTVKDVSAYVTITYSPDAKKIGATDRKQWMKTIIADAKAGKGTLTPEGSLKLIVPEAPDGKVILTADEFEAVYTPKEGSTIAFAGSAGYVIGLDTTLDEELTIEGYSRDLIRAIQDARKELGFQVTDRLQLSITSENDTLGKILSAHQGMIEKETLCSIAPLSRGMAGNAGGFTEKAREVEIDEGFVILIELN